MIGRNGFVGQVFGQGDGLWGEEQDQDQDQDHDHDQEFGVSGLLLDSVEVLFGAEKEGISGDGRGGHETSGKGIGGDDLWFWTTSENGSLALFVKAVNAAVCEQWGGGVCAGNSFGPDFLSGFGIEAGEDAIIGE